MKANCLKKGTWKRWLSTALTVTMLVGVGMPNEVYAEVNDSAPVPDGYTTDENGLMAYRYTSEEAYVYDGDDDVFVDGIDIIGYVEGKWRGTTYDNNGNTVIIKIDDEIIPVKKIDGSKPIKDGVELYVNVTPSFVSDGQLIKLTYTVENKGSIAVDYSIAGFADAEFNDNDDCPIVNVGEVKNGSAFALNDIDDDSDKTISFAVFPLSASTSNYHQYWAYQNYFVDGINGYWLYDDDDDDNALVTEKNLKQEGLYNEKEECFEDSGYSFAWNNQTLGAGESKSYSALFGVGDLENLEDAAAEESTPIPDPTPEPTPEPTPTPDPTPEVHTHTIVTDAAVAPTCTETGKTEGKHCSVCGEVITAQTTIPAKGHDWSGQWIITKLATTIDEGKKELECKNGCGQKKHETIPVIGTQEDPDDGKLEKDAQVAPEAPIEEVTLNNKKSELLNASDIFTKEEKEAIEAGEEARVWMEVSKTDESKIAEDDKEEMTEAAKTVMGDNPVITYFDADLFKKVGNGKATQLKEPGINIDVTIKIPSDLLNNSSTIEREYKIIRLHIDEKTGNSIVDILSGNFDKATGNFTFQTDKFSTYAIVYTDKPVSENATQDHNTNTNTNTNTNAIPENPENVAPTNNNKSVVRAPKTGDTNTTTLWTIILMLSAGVTVGAFKRRKNNI